MLDDDGEEEREVSCEIILAVISHFSLFSVTLPVLGCEIHQFWLEKLMEVVTNSNKLWHHTCCL